MMRRLENHLGPIGAMLTLLIVGFGDIFRKGMILGNDIQTEFMWKRAYTFGAGLKGDLPLWNPYQFTGYPFMANFQSALFYPLNWIFLVLEMHSAFIVSTFIHLFLAGLFMYALVYGRTRKKIPSLLAGILMTANGGLLARVFAGHVTIVCSYPWMIFCLLTFDRALRPENTPLVTVRWSLLTGVGLCLTVLAGYPMISYYTVLCLGFYTLARTILETEKKEIPVRLASNFGYLLLVGGAAALLSAIQVWPSYFAFLENSARAGGTSYDFATSYSFPPENLMTYLSPFFFGDMFTTPYWGRWFLWEIMPYIGIFPLMLVLLAFYAQKKTIQIFLAMAVLAVILSFGRYTFFFPFLYEYFPGLNLFRGPGRILLIFGVASSAVAGFFLHALSQDKALAKRAFGTGWKLCFTFAAVLLVLLVIMKTERFKGQSFFWKTVIGQSFQLGERDEGPPKGFGTPGFYHATYENAVSQLWIAIVLLVCTGGLFLYGVKKGVAKPFIPLAMALVCVDLGLAGRHFLKSTDPSELHFPSKIVTLLKQHSVVPPRIATTSGTDDLSRGALDGISHIGGYDVGMPRHYIEYVNRMNDLPLDESLVVSSPMKPGRMIRMTGITHMITPRNRPAYPDSTLVMESGERAVYRLNDPLPRSFIVHKVRILPDKAQRLERIRHPDFDPLKEAVLETEPATRLDATATKDEGETVTFRTYEPEQVALQIRAASTGLLVLTDSYNPNWRVRVDGIEKPLLKVNHLFRGVVVDKGEHEVVFTYSRTRFNRSMAVTIASAVLILLLFLGEGYHCYRAS